MKFKADRATLLKALAHIQSVAEKRNTIPILANVLIAVRDGKLSFTATDMEIAVVEEVGAAVSRNGATTAPAATLYEIVRKLPEGADVELDHPGGDAQLALRSGRYAVATDGHRLARVEEPLPEGAGSMPGVIIPRKTVAELRKLLDEASGEVEVALSDTRVQFAIGQVTLTSKLIDGTFPEYERVIPRDNDKVLRVGKKDFADAVARVAAISSERSRPVKLSLARDLLVLSAASPEQGTATEEMEADRITYEAGPLEIGFQARYLNDITDQIENQVEFRFSDGAAPTVVRDAADPTALYVLMPMRV